MRKVLSFAFCDSDHADQEFLEAENEFFWSVDDFGLKCQEALVTIAEKTEKSF